MRLVLGARLDELVADRMLHAQVDREVHRLLQPVAREPRQMQVGETAVVQPFLDAGDALVVDIDVAEQVRDQRPVRIDALVLVHEADAGQAETMDLDTLGRRDLALEPDEALLRRQPLAHLGRIEIRNHCGEQFDRLVHVDDAVRLAEERSGIFTSVARISPLRSRISGRAVATASAA